jgi:hypothetical protein
MAITAKPGSNFEVKITKQITRAQAATTLERLFMADRKIARPIEARAKNHLAKPKRRGGRIWTKWPNKVHPKLEKGVSATIPATAQFAKDLASVADFVEVKTV